MRSLDENSGFAAATRAAQAVIAADAADRTVRPQSHSRLLSHGSRTERAVLLLHGYTHGPEQMDALAGDFHARGYNVWVPRAPGHGTTDPGDHRRITTSGLTMYATRGLDIAAGLGGEVGVVGISAGAILATWLTQQSGPAVNRLLLLSPFFGPAPGQVPASLLRPLTFLYGRGLLPDRVTSRGYSLRSVSRYLAITRHLVKPARPAGLRSIALVISALDDVVDTAAATAVPARIAGVGVGVGEILLPTLVVPELTGLGHDTLSLAGRPDEGELRGQYIRLYETGRTTVGTP
ncbi:alpha/beta fold hydrolase [Actinoplanes sp. TRM 88003]|uniref:Alpha/beta fold hydrolase n=1 Tax=Paractinoplanes aksuensis TaxID=2939490 RepID=A0ABT1DXD1_9ACTN|nr:alpha/beta fold hydrolase [Actinoplanes aksuensis]MCO8275521.1 alpha/beta fold hydrolase [Actinoplanes aksuensis]